VALRLGKLLSGDFGLIRKNPVVTLDLIGRRDMTARLPDRAVIGGDDRGQGERLSVLRRRVCTTGHRLDLDQAKQLVLVGRDSRQAPPEDPGFAGCRETLR
jgi:hypothetical protein